MQPPVLLLAQRLPSAPLSSFIVKMGDKLEAPKDHKPQDPPSALTSALHKGLEREMNPV